MADIDKLSIEITSESKEAANGVDALVRSLEKLDSATKGGLGLGSTNKNLSSLNTALENSAKSSINLWAKLKMGYSAMKPVTNFIGSSIKKINDYIENVNLFNVAMGEYAKEAGKYAERVGDVMDIDPGEWMRSQGVFMTLATGFGVVGDRAYTMSKNLTQLGYDISSFFNIPYEDAMQKLQSGLAGELEPLRRIGYDLSQARLQQEAYTLGITKKISAMTQAEKAELRYYAIMNQVTTAQGDMARTLSAPANQLRILSAQFTQAARAIGSIFIPMLNAVLPYVTAFVILVRDLVANLATLFGFEMPKVDYSGVDSLTSGADDAADALGKAGDNAKELQKYTMGFDELNVIDPTADSDESGDPGALGGTRFDFVLPEYDFLGDAVKNQIDALKTSLGLTISDVFLEWGSEITSENLLEKLVVGLGAVAGGIIGFKLGGVQGAVIGALVGTAMTLAINSLVFNHDGKVSSTELFDLLRDIFIVGSAGVLGFTTGGMKGAAIGITIGFGLTLLLETLEMKGNGSIAHTIENTLMALVPIGLGIGLGKKVGLTFLQGFDDVFITGAGTMRSFSAGLSSVSGALTSFQRGMVGVVGGVAEFLGVFTGVKNITFDVSNGSATLGSIFSGLIPIVAGLTAGFIAFSIAFNSTGIGSLVTLIVGAAAALVGLVKGIEEAGQAAYEETPDFMMMEDIISRSADTADRCKTAMDNMQSGIDSIQTASDNFAMAGSLVNEIMAINENADASAYELAEMQTKVDILNGLGIEGLSLSIDETTGRVTQSREEVEKLIGSLEQEAKMEAMRDLLVQSYKDQYTAMSDAKKALSDYNVANESLAKTSEELANCSWFDFKKRAELKAAQEEEAKAVQAAKDAYDTARETVDSLSGTIETYTDELTNMKLEEVGVGDELLAGLSDVETGLVETGEKMPELGKNLSDGLLEGAENAMDSNKQSWLDWSWLPWNWFKDKNEIHSPSKLFEGGGLNIAQGLFNGVDKNTKQTDYDGVWGRLKTWADTLFGTTSGDSSVFKSIGSYLSGGLFGGVDEGVSQDSYTTVFSRVSSALSSVKGDIVDIVNSILGFIEKMANGVIDGVNGMITKLNSLSIDAPDWVEKQFGISSFGFNIPLLQRVSIPRIELKADGGFVDTGQLFIAREAGAEMVGSIGRKTAVANNDQIVAGIASGVASANTESNALLREQNTLLRAMLEKETGVYLDGKTITKSVEKHQRERGRVLVTGGAY